jgi:uncharacterized lipoprotein YmbA
MKVLPWLATLALLLAGCGSSQNFYSLTAEAPAAHGTASVSLGVGPVRLPTYVDRTELVYQSGPNQFAVPADALWAGPLRDNMTDVLATNLERLLGAPEVLTFPWPPGRIPARAVTIQVRQFHAISGVDAIFDFSWQIVHPDTGTTGTRHSATLREPIHGDGYGPVVAAESRLLERAAEEIARNL